MEKHSLLIVDDEEHVRQAIARTLQGEGYQIRFAAGAKEALAQLGETPADMILSDHTMPVMTGLELLRTVRRDFPDTLRVILTGNADLQLAIAAINEGEIYRFLTKPWDMYELQITVRLGFERLMLERDNRRLLATVKRQSDFIRALESEHPGISAVERDARGAVVIEDEEILEQYAATLRSRAV